MVDELFGEGENFSRMVVNSTFTAAKEPLHVILSAIREKGFSEDAIFAIRLGMEEAMTNAIKHGNKSDPDRRVTVYSDINRQRAIVVLADEGVGFCPNDVPDCTSDVRISRPDGRGIMLMRAYLDEVAFSRKGDAVRLVKVNK